MNDIGSDPGRSRLADSSPLNADPALKKAPTNRPAAEKVAPAVRDKRLQALGVQFKRLPDIENDRGCQQIDAVEVTGVGDVKFTRPALISAELAEKVGYWVKDVVHPAAAKTRKQLAAIDVYGSYSCRNAYGRPFGSLKGRLSQHAYANAVDIGGFKFRDGTQSEYKKDWKSGPTRDFLHAVSVNACGLFNTTLTPDYDRYHWHHIHLDTSPNNNLCGYKGRFDAALAAKSVPAGTGKGVKAKGKTSSKATPAKGKPGVKTAAKSAAKTTPKKPVAGRQTVVVVAR